METRAQLIDKLTKNIVNYIIIDKDGNDLGIDAALMTMLCVMVDIQLKEIN